MYIGHQIIKEATLDTKSGFEMNEDWKSELLKKGSTEVLPAVKSGLKSTGKKILRKGERVLGKSVEGAAVGGGAIGTAKYTQNKHRDSTSKRKVQKPVNETMLALHPVFRKNQTEEQQRMMKVFQKYKTAAEARGDKEMAKRYEQRITAHQRELSRSQALENHPAAKHVEKTLKASKLVGVAGIGGTLGGADLVATGLGGGHKPTAVAGGVIGGLGVGALAATSYMAHRDKVHSINLYNKITQDPAYIEMQTKSELLHQKNTDAGAKIFDIGKKEFAKAGIPAPYFSLMLRTSGEVPAPYAKNLTVQAAAQAYAKLSHKLAPLYDKAHENGLQIMKVENDIDEFIMHYAQEEYKLKKVHESLILKKSKKVNEVGAGIGYNVLKREVAPLLRKKTIFGKTHPIAKQAAAELSGAKEALVRRRNIAREGIAQKRTAQIVAKKARVNKLKTAGKIGAGVATTGALGVPIYGAYKKRNA